MSQREPLVLKVHNYCPCAGHNSQIKRFLKKHYGIPKERIDEGELNNGKVRVVGDVDANKLREHLKSYLHKEVTIEKDPKKGSSNPNTSELGHYSRDQPWAKYGQVNQISQHPIGQSPLGQTGAQFGQMGQSGQHPMGQLIGGYNQESLYMESFHYFRDDNVNGCTIM